MLSQQMWRRLVQPNDNPTPLFRYLRISKLRAAAYSVGYTGEWIFLYLIFGMLLMPVLIFMMPLFTVIGFVPMWAAMTAGEIQYEEEQARLDLLSLLPDGARAVYYDIATIQVQRGPLLGYVRDSVQMMSLIGGLVVMGLMSGIAVAVLAQDAAAADLLLRMVEVLIVVFVVVLVLPHDQIQSVALGQLVGMVTALYTHTPWQARVMAGMGMLALQTMLYTLVGAVGVWLLPMLFKPLLFGNALAAIITGTAFVGLREWLVYYLWHHLSDQLGETRSFVVSA